MQFGRTARRNNILAAKLVAETVRTTLGPKGMDKMLVDSMGEVVVTNDGVTILREMAIEHPTAKMIVEVAKTQEQEVGDGTTSAVIIAGELLKQAEELLDKNIHPTIITKGYRLAADHALSLLGRFAKPVTLADTEMLQNIARTAMTGKSAELAKESLATLSVDAVRRVTEVVAKDGKKLMRIDLDNIKRQTVVGHSTEQSLLVEGLIIDKERVHPGMPSRLEHVKVALLNTPLEIRDTETESRITITSPEQMQAFLDQEERMLHTMVDKVIKSGATVVVTQKGIDEVAQHYLSKAGIFAVRRVKKSDIEALSKATGATLVTNLNDLNQSVLGKASLVEQRKIGDVEMTVFSGCASTSVVTLLITGSTSHIVAEMLRSVDDALGDLASAIRDGKIVPGAGAPEIMLSRGLREFSSTLSGKEQLAVQAFARSMEVIPVTLAENAGFDPIDALTELHAAHERGMLSAGINVFGAGVIDALKDGVVEPLKVKTQAITSATQVAVVILRIDDIIAASPMSEKDGAPNLDEY